MYQLQIAHKKCNVVIQFCNEHLIWQLLFAKGGVNDHNSNGKAASYCFRISLFYFLDMLHLKITGNILSFYKKN
jgi:hypothetical protein